jgi:hypothetical protein
MFRNAKVRILFDTAKSFLTGGSRSLFFFSCSLRSRDLVDLVDYFLSGIFFRVRGWFRSGRFYKVSLTACDGLYFCLIAGMRYRVNVLM